MAREVIGTDREAIGELKARYCRFLDLKRWDDWRNLFTEDFLLDTTEAGGPAAISGRDAAVTMVRGSIENVKTAHHVHAGEIAISGATATGIWAMQDRLIFANGAGMVGYGHYTETYVKMGGEWKIASSKLTRLMVEMTGTTGTSA